MLAAMNEVFTKRSPVVPPRLFKVSRPYNHCIPLKPKSRVPPDPYDRHHPHHRIHPRILFLCRCVLIACVGLVLRRVVSQAHTIYPSTSKFSGHQPPILESSMSIPCTHSRGMYDSCMHNFFVSLCRMLPFSLGAAAQSAFTGILVSKLGDYRFVMWTTWVGTECLTHRVL